MSLMAAYLCQARNAYKTIMAYKQDMVVRALRSLLMLLPQIYIWKALYGVREAVAGISLEQMITYVVLSRCVAWATSASGGQDLERKMKSGDIGLDLLRPTSPRLLFIAQNLGSMAGGMLLDVLPLLLLAIVLMRGLQPPASPAALGFFALSLVGAMLIQIWLELFLGTLAFWFVDVYSMSWLLGFFQTVFSGAIVPLWFLPTWMADVAMALPFQAATFTPLALYMGQYPGGNPWQALGLQAMWIVVFFVAQTILWQRGLRRLVLLGG